MQIPTLLLRVLLYTPPNHEHTLNHLNVSNANQGQIWVKNGGGFGRTQWKWNWIWASVGTLLGVSYLWLVRVSHAKVQIFYSVECWFLVWGLVWVRGGDGFERKQGFLVTKNRGSFGQLLGRFWKPFAVKKCGSRERFRKLGVSEFKNL